MISTRRKGPSMPHETRQIFALQALSHATTLFAGSLLLLRSIDIIYEKPD